MVSNPRSDIGEGQTPVRDGRDKDVFFFFGTRQPITVDSKKKIHGRKGCPFVRIYEGMIFDQRVKQSGSFLGDSRIKIKAAESRLGTSKRRIEKTDIPYTLRPSRCFKNSTVDFEQVIQV